MRLTAFATNTARGQLAVLELRHRTRARCEDRMGGVAPVVCVHGVGQQVKGERSLMKDWYPALIDGLTRAREPPVRAMGYAWPSTATCSARLVNDWPS
jgi:hypothetical protein